MSNFSHDKGKNVQLRDNTVRKCDDDTSSREARQLPYKNTKSSFFPVNTSLFSSNNQEWNRDNIAKEPQIAKKDPQSIWQNSGEQPPISKPSTSAEWKQPVWNSDYFLSKKDGKGSDVLFSHEPKESIDSEDPFFIPKVLEKLENRSVISRQKFGKSTQFNLPTSKFSCNDSDNYGEERSTQNIVEEDTESQSEQSENPGFIAVTEDCLSPVYDNDPDQYLCMQNKLRISDETSPYDPAESSRWRENNAKYKKHSSNVSNKELKTHANKFSESSDLPWTGLSPDIKSGSQTESPMWRNKNVNTGRGKGITSYLRVSNPSALNSLQYPAWKSLDDSDKANFKHYTSDYHEKQTDTCVTSQTDYLRLMQGGKESDYLFVIDKIISNNEQQASLALQEKMKSSTDNVTNSIINIVIKQCYPLMVNRFGNFLIQRCIENGDSNQIDRIGSIIDGRTVKLSMDPFGCHVVQKAFEYVTEVRKISMIDELVEHIPETIANGYACHVWQKILELNWTGVPPPIMSYINHALRGTWDKVAVWETGSLVVQNIFENCLPVEKEPAIHDILSNIDTVARGKFGNYVIQHILENGEKRYREKVTKFLLENTEVYSVHPQASKIIERAIKVNDENFISCYLQKILQKKPNRPRTTLIGKISCTFLIMMLIVIIKISAATCQVTLLFSIYYNLRVYLQVYENKC